MGEPAVIHTSSEILDIQKVLAALSGLSDALHPVHYSDLKVPTPNMIQSLSSDPGSCSNGQNTNVRQAIMLC
jgi:hypothetical protein